MVGAGARQVHQFGDEKAKEADCAGGAGVDMGKSLLLHVVDHLKKRREVKLELRILGKGKIADRSKVHDPVAESRSLRGLR